MNQREYNWRRNVKLFNLNEKKRKKFYEGVIREHFRKYEAKHYFKPMQELVENKFVTYMMKQDNYPLLYHNMVTTQRDIDWKNIEDRVE